MTEQQQQQKLAASSSSASSSLLAAATPEDDAKERKEAQEERVHVRDFTSPEGASSSAVAPPAPSNRGILNDADSIGESRPVKRHGRKGGLPMTRTISFSTPPDLPFPKRKSRFARRDTRETDSSDDGEDTLSEFSSDDGSSSEGGRRRKTRFRPHVPHRIRRLRKEKQETETEKEEDEEDEGHERPATDRVYRRTPVFSGTIAPFSIMLEIPGFTSKWYVRTGGQVYRPNPPVLDVGLALSLFFAVIANAAVLARFAERLSPRLATLIAVCGFLVHDVINIVALVVFAVIHNVDDGFTYSEAFWMTTAATGASLLCTTSLLLDYRNTKNFRSAGSGLTRKQSQLVMAIMAFLAYISISALIYSLVMQLQFLDAMYFMVESLATVGLGDVTPKGTAAKVLLFFIAPGGIVLLAVVIAFARQTILEELENAYKKNRALYKEKLAQRAQEQRQLKGVKHALKRRFTSVRRGVTRQFSIAPDVRPAPQADQAKAEAGTDKDEGATAAAGRVILEHGDGAPVPLYESPSGSCVDLSIDTSPAPASAPTHEQLTATPSIRSRHDTLHSIAPSDMQAMTEMEAELVAQRQEIDARFHHFTLTLSKRERAEFWAKIGLSALLFVGFWVVGAAVFSAIEGWTYFEGFYFSFVIFSSIGYGDLAPQTSSGRAFFIVWTLAGFGTLTVLLSILTDAGGDFFQKRRRIKSRKDRRKKRVRQPHDEEKHVGERQTEKKHDKEEESSPSSSPSTLKFKQPSSSTASLPPAPSSSHETAKPPSIVSLTRTAMSMHRGALEMLQLDRHTLVDAFRHFPDLISSIHHQQQHHQQGRDDGSLTKQARSLTPKQRERVIKTIEETGDEKLVLIVRQWLLLAEFEEHLHEMFRHSTLLHSESVEVLSEDGDGDNTQQDIDTSTHTV